MNSPALILHLVVKDFRHQRLTLLLVWMLAAALPFIARHDAGMVMFSASPVMALGLGGLLLLLCFVLVRLIRLDAPGRDFHFLATRPIGWLALLVGKFIFIIVFLFTPVLVARWAGIPLLEIPMSGMDVFLYLVETAIYVSAALAVCTLFALFVRRIHTIFAALLATTILIVFCSVWLQGRALRDGTALPWVDPSLQSSRLLVFCVAICLTICLVAWLRYSRKSIVSPLSVLFVGLILSFVLKTSWPWHFGRLFPDATQRESGMPAAIRDQKALDFSPSENQSDTALTGSQFNGIRSMGLDRYVTLKGMQPPYFARIATYHAEATLKSGRVIHSAYEDVSGHGGVGGLSNNLKYDILGFPAAKEERWDFYRFELFNYRPDEYRKEDLTGARIKGILSLEIRRAVVVKKMPFRTGASVDWYRTHYVLREAVVNPSSVDHRITSYTISSALRGDSRGFAPWKELKWVIYHHTEREHLRLGSEGSSGNEGVFSYQRNYQGSYRKDIFSSDRKKAKERFSDDWIEGAEIAFIGSEPCGTICLPYEIQSVDLIH